MITNELILKHLLKDCRYVKFYNFEIPSVFGLYEEHSRVMKYFSECENDKYEEIMIKSSNQLNKKDKKDKHRPSNLNDQLEIIKTINFKTIKLIGFSFKDVEEYLSIKEAISSINKTIKFTNCDIDGKEINTIKSSLNSNQEGTIIKSESNQDIRMNTSN